MGRRIIAGALAVAFSLPTAAQMIDDTLIQLDLEERNVPASVRQALHGLYDGFGDIDEKIDEIILELRREGRLSPEEVPIIGMTYSDLSIRVTPYRNMQEIAMTVEGIEYFLLRPASREFGYSPWYALGVVRDGKRELIYMPEFLKREGQRGMRGVEHVNAEYGALEAMTSFVPPH